jgi:hypothetical protein
MRHTLRAVLAIVTAFIVATAVMMLVEAANGRFIYPELGKAAEGVTDRAEVRQLMAAAPVGALFVVLAGWFVGTVAGGFAAAKIASRAPAAHALAVGAIIALFGIANNLMIPPPAWFWVAGLLAPLAAGALTARVVRAK